MMPKFWKTAAVGLVALGAGLAAAPPPDPAPGPGPLETRDVAAEGLAGQLRAVERHLNAVDTLEAAFIQQAPDGSLSRGRLYLDRPGKLRFEYTDGTPLLLVSDGTLLTFIDYDVGQVTKWPIEDTALGLLVAKTVTLENNKAVVGAGPGPDGDVLTVTARDPQRPEQGYLTLIFDQAKELSLQGWEVVDAQGSVTRIRLQDAQMNVALKDDLWAYDDPRQLPSQRRRKRR